ncbi:MAG: TolC family protein [Comamonadaceae bacterium]|nr:TolC family protein [Comamonadaceae bacterium]
MPEVAGELGTKVDDALPYRLEQLLASAPNLPRQRALAAREDAARARLGVERGNRNPDVTIGVHAGREGPSDARERLAIVSLSVPLPLFKRNDAAVGQAITDMTQAEVERASRGCATPRCAYGNSGAGWPASASAFNACSGCWCRRPPTTSTCPPSRARPDRSACLISCSSTARRSTPNAT